MKTLLSSLFYACTQVTGSSPSRTLLLSSAGTGSRWARLLALFLALSVSTGGLQAQLVLSEGFEANCTTPSNAFFLGCFPSWISTHGSPDNLSNFAGVSAYAGSKYAHGYVRYSFNCFTGTAASANRGEGVAINYNFQAGIKYKITYAFRSTGNLQSKEWLLVPNALPNQTGSPNTCDLTERVPARPAGSVVVHVPGNNTTWQVYEQEFTPASNFSQLWFRSAFDNPPVLNWEAFGRYFIDAVGIEIVCDPANGVAAYHFEDANGNPKDHFCFGQDVYLDGTASQNETRYYIDAWRRPIGSPAGTPFSWAAGLGWTLNQQVGVINLSDAFAAQGYYFEPGYEYQIKLAISGEDCITWTEVLHEFKIECCNTFIYPGFGLDLVQQGTLGDLSLYVHSYQGYENMNATHEWIVLASPNQYGGPYSQIYSTTTTGSANFVLYDQVQPGLFYTVIHKITTACDEVCFGKQRYADEFFRDGEEAGVPDGLDVPDSESCELCGFINCAILDEICYAPSNVRVSQISGGFFITWDAVHGATGYTVIITANDPDCCSEGEVFEIGVSTFRNSLRFMNLYNLDCISVQVAAHCGRDLSWSEKVCFQPHRPGTGPDGAGQALTAPVSKARVFPNPTNSELNISFETPHTGQVEVIDALGRVIAQQTTEESMNTSFDLSGQPAGFYWLIARSGDQVQKFKVVKQ